MALHRKNGIHEVCCTAQQRLVRLPSNVTLCSSLVN